MKNYKQHRGMVQVRVQADNSYQIKRVLRAVEKERGFVLMSSSGVKHNGGNAPRLRLFASFKDLKEERKKRKQSNVNR